MFVSHRDYLHESSVHEEHVLDAMPLLSKDSMDAMKYNEGGGDAQAALSVPLSRWPLFGEFRNELYDNLYGNGEIRSPQPVYNLFSFLNDVLLNFHSGTQWHAGRPVRHSKPENVAVPELEMLSFDQGDNWRENQRWMDLYENMAQIDDYIISSTHQALREKRFFLLDDFWFRLGSDAPISRIPFHADTDWTCVSYVHLRTCLALFAEGAVRITKDGVLHLNSFILVLRHIIDERGLYQAVQAVAHYMFEEELWLWREDDYYERYLRDRENVQSALTQAFADLVDAKQPSS